ncbi:MAG: trypsin-like peptidase domain-containing protein [Nostoc sp.]|uniref:trypsin-like peptidase domain-containing protein n=1 Tax=unclassified Nostoc TaxID=2593658 RepID=UPI0025F98CD3|nr:trypsin-like peptidase domain-containing protein [Nostoc sp. NMS9]MBN3938685.1 trypsin-like peptidase domain-containing protein [Nostoc sp. NMS9]
MSFNPDESIFLLTSKNPENESFGTGFVIKQDSRSTYILTCAHVIRDVGGIDQVEVDSYSVTIVAQSQDGYADDLAVLKIESILGNSILPLGIFGKTGSSFMIFGCWLYDKRSKQYRLEQIKGFLGKSVKLKSRHQAGFIDAWQLKIDDESSLQPGFSGSPVIDSKSYTVIGIVSHLEGQGRSGQAISLASLKRIWAELPPDFFREKLYDLLAVSELIKAVFIDENQFSLFLNKNFASISRETIPFLLKVQLLIDYCHHHNQISELLNHIKIISPSKYRKYISSINQESNSFSSYNHSSNICKCFRGFIFKSKQTKATIQVRSQCEIELVFEDLSKFKPEVREAAIGALAGVLNISREEIKIIEIRKGSVKLRIEIPSSALDRLIELYETNRAMMRDLGIVYLTEILDEHFDLSNIRSLLNGGFTREELLTICYDNFRAVSEQIDSNTGKAEIIEQLLEYIRQQMLVSDLLDLARESKPEAYNKFGSYYKVPRRPSRQREQRLPSHQLTRWEIILAVFFGAGITILGILALLFVDYIVSTFDSTGILSSIVWLGFLPLGDFVGSVVLRVLRGRRGEQTGRLAVISYLIGCFALPVGLFSIIFLFILVLAIMNASRDPIGSLQLIGQLIITTLKIISSFLNPLNNLSTPIGIAGGGYLAYQRAR